MEQINQYSFIKCIQTFNENINLWRCEKENKEFEILTINQKNDYERLLKRALTNEIKPLLNRDFLGIQKIIEKGFDAENKVHFIVYEALEAYKKLFDYDDNTQNQALSEIAKGLDLLKKENRQTHIISPQNIVVNSKGNAKLKFIGLFELFRHQDLLEKRYLAPNVQKWLADTKLPRPNFQDDIYALIKSFEMFFGLDSEIEQQILDKALAPKRIERFSKYYELIELLEQIPIAKQINFYEDVIRVKTQPKHTQDFMPIIESMKQNTWILVENKKSDNKNQITGRFSTDTWNGRFFVDEYGYIFIPFGGCRNERNDRLIRNENAFLAEFDFDLNYSNYDCLRFFEEKFEEQNRLSQLHRTKTKSVKLWQTLPDKEKEYIEERAFKARYTKRVESQNNSANIKFYLEKTVVENSWKRVKTLKNEQVILFVDDQRIGTILDFHPKERFITIKDAFCSIDEIAEKGELIEDVRQKTSQFKKQVEACKKFENGDVVNPSLCSILATSETTAMPQTNFLETWQYENFADEVFNPDLENDETQREAVLEALHHKPVYLIQGPPGTGKTTVIVELLRQILRRQKDVKILVCSQSNLAVDNVLEKIAYINENEHQDIRFMRLASEFSIQKNNISQTIVPHTFETKLKNWVTKTEERAKQFFVQNFSEQEKQKIVIEFYNFYAQLDKTRDWDKFNRKLRRSHSYIKRLFGQTRDFRVVKLIFEKELGKKFLKLKSLQKDWFAFLGGVTVDDGRDRKKSMLNNGSTEIDFLTAMMQQLNIIGATCIHIASSQYSRVNFQFDYVIMDESSKASAAETLVPINMGQNIILIGDHKQLPPVITREDAVKKKVKRELEDNGLDFDKDFGESLFEKLIKAFENDEDKENYIKMLDVQYRMPKQIGSLISKYFYDGMLKNPRLNVIPNYDAQKHHGLRLKKDTSIIFLSTSRQANPSDNDNKFNRQNRCNVLAIQNLLEQLNELYADNLQKEKPFNIGIIAGYRGQVELLRSRLNLQKYRNFVEKDSKDRAKSLIEINTVDKFQGAERDIIIYDIVRSTKGRSNIGFLDDYRRINVAFSRVKRLLIVVGDSDYLIKRATLNPRGKFKEFKLQQIAQELEQKDLIVNDLKEIVL